MLYNRTNCPVLEIEKQQKHHEVGQVRLFHSPDGRKFHNWRPHQTFFKMGGFPKNSAAAVLSCCEFLSLFSKCWKKFAKQLTCGAMTKIVIKVKRVKLIHTKERKNRKKEPIPAPKCPEEKMKQCKLIQVMESILN